MKNQISVTQQNSRRLFLKQSAALAAGVTLGSLAIGQPVHAAGSDVIKAGLIGCGGRGCGAAVNAMNAGPDVHITAVGDLFPDYAQLGRERLKNQNPDQVEVDDDHVFSGFDAYQKVIASDVDVVLIAASSRFHPQFLQAAVDAGKHVFVEKPHSIHAPGLKTVQKACDEAVQKGLSVVSGLCWRYDVDVRETMQRVKDGMIGDIIAIEETYLRTPYHIVPRKPEWSELESQFRNWYHFNWLAGDDTLQSLIHNLDRSAWALNDEPPVAAFGTGGRATPFDGSNGDQFDNFTVAYEYANGVRVYGFNRAQAGVFCQTAGVLMGTKGQAYMPSRCKIVVGGEVVWEPDRKQSKPSMYDMEHKELFESIRSGKPINNGVYMVRSTLLAMMARMVGYSGQKITWEEAMQSTDLLGPEDITWETTPPVVPGPDGCYACPVPGLTKFV